MSGYYDISKLYPTNMNSSKDIKRRIKSISGTLQITKALELISSIKMRHAIRAAETSRDFSSEIWQLILALRESQNGDTAKLPLLFKQNTTKNGKNLLIVVAGDKGLAGSYNSNILRAARDYLRDHQDTEVDAITVGRKARKIKQLSRSLNIVSDYEVADGGQIDFFQASPITKLAIDSFLDGQYGQVTIIYTHFLNTLRQKPVVRNILPISDATAEELAQPAAGDSSDGSIVKLLDFKYEPDQYTLLEVLGRLAVRSQIYQALLEANASEHAARMVAMKNATENGKELVDDLKFTFNQLRQQNITRELSEIAAGAAAIH